MLEAAQPRLITIATIGRATQAIHMLLPLLHTLYALYTNQLHPLMQFQEGTIFVLITAYDRLYQTRDFWHLSPEDISYNITVGLFILWVLAGWVRMFLGPTVIWHPAILFSSGWTIDDLMRPTPQIPVEDLEETLFLGRSGYY